MKIIKFVLIAMFVILGFCIIAFNVSTKTNDEKLDNEFIGQNSDFVKQWGLYNDGQIIGGKRGKRGVDINVLQAWEITKGSSKVLVGVLDTGVEFNCKEFENSIFQNRNEIPGNSLDDDNNGFIDDVMGWNFTKDNNCIFENTFFDSHGTSISGIIAASHNNASIYGVAPNSLILPLKFLSASEGNIEDVINAIDYGYKQGVRIFNCSWDSTLYNDKLLEIMKKYYDVLFICSAGKSADNLDTTPVYPACFDLPNIVAVAAIDNQGKLYKLSGYGDEADVAAPGVDIYCLESDGEYRYSSGTSEATAYVTGIAALVKSYNYDLTSIEIAEILKKSSKHLNSLKRKVKSGGIIDAYQCLENSKPENSKTR